MLLQTLRQLADMPPYERIGAIQNVVPEKMRFFDSEYDQIELLTATYEGLGLPGARARAACEAAVYGDWRSVLDIWKVSGIETFRCVLVLEGPTPWIGAACVHALLTEAILLPVNSGNICQAVAALGELPMSITLVGAPDSLDNGLLAAISRHLGTPNPELGAIQHRFGLLTARNPHSLVNLIYRSRRLRATGVDHRELLVSHAEELAEVPDQLPPRLTVLNRNETRPEHLRAGFEQGVNVLSLLAHGRDDILRIKGAGLCGRAPEAALTGEYGGLPACAQTGACYQKIELVDPLAFPAPVVFINSCAALKLAKSVFPTTFNVGLRFLDGETCALVASPFMTNGKQWQNILFHHLFGSGRPLGEVVRILNEATARSGLDFPGLQLVGDPDLMVRNPAPSRVISCSEQENESPFVISTNEQHFVEIALPLLAEEPMTVSVNERLPIKRPIYYAFSKVGAELRLFLFSLWPLPQQLTITTHGHDLLNELRASSDEGYETIRNAEWLGIRDQELDRLIPEMHQNMRSVQAVAESQRYLLQSASLAIRRSQHAAKLKGVAAERLLQWLLTGSRENNLHFYEMYRHSYSVSDWIWGGTCYLCGDVTVTFRANCNLVRGQERQVHLCPTCGVIQDGQGDIELRFQGPSQLIGTAHLAKSLRVTNRGSTMKAVRIGVTVINGSWFGITTTPDQGDVSLGPGEAVDFHFTLSATETTAAHHFWLRAYALVSGQVVAADSNIWRSLPQDCLLEERAHGEQTPPVSG